MAGPGCGPVGCLARIVGCIVGLVVLLVVAGYLAVSGLYVFSPRPVREGPDRFLGANTVGYLQINDNPLHEVADGLIRKLADSLVQTPIERCVAKSPQLVRPFARGLGWVLRHDIVPEVMPFAAFSLLSQNGTGARITSAWVANSRMPSRVLSLAGWVWDRVAGNRNPNAAPLTVEGAPEDSGATFTYPTRTLGKTLTTFDENWILLADSPAGLRSLLDRSRHHRVPEFVPTLRSYVSDTSDLIFLLDNRYRAVQLILQDLEPKRGTGKPDVLAYVLGITPPVSDQILGVAAQGLFVTDDSLRARIVFTMKSELAALAFEALLGKLQPSIQQSLARSHMSVGYALARDRYRVVVTAGLAGVRQPILQLPQ